MNKPSPELELKAINAIRFLSADGVQKANSGHPGLPMGAAAMAYALWTRCLRYNPHNPAWPDRDRFILSGGHGSMLLYSLLYLTGFPLSLDELKNFRQLGSLTPGHPEYGLTPGVEATTGPLGQGFANGVGMAIAAQSLAARFNQPGFPLFNHYIYAIVTDGDLMEGVTSEAASLAGHLQLGRLIYLYDDNHISIDGKTEIAFTEDRLARFAAYHWHVQSVADGNDVAALEQAILAAQADPRPSIIAVRTQIGFGLPTRQGTAKAHGEPPGQAELDGAKQNLGWPLEPTFYVPAEVLAFFRQAVEQGAGQEAAWNQLLATYRQAYPDLATELDRRLAGDLPASWAAGLPVYAADRKGAATRITSGLALNVLAQRLPELMGGSADLAPSNKTWIEGEPAFQNDHPEGRNFHFGVREHGMASIVNGMAIHGGVIPYCATFLTFSDYMRPAMRVAALSEYPSIFVFTHDSIGLGEDGPTHQPVEHLAALRAIPNLVVLRPGDANEVVESWKVAIARRHGPTALALSRQNMPILDRTVYAPSAGLAQGAYVLADLGPTPPQVVLMASGSELGLILDAGEILAAEGLGVRLVSFPSWELFASQPEEYRVSVLPPGLKARVAVEAGIRQGWERWTGADGAFVGMHGFGQSAPYEVLYRHFNLTVEAVCVAARLQAAGKPQPLGID